MRFVALAALCITAVLAGLLWQSRSELQRSAQQLAATQTRLSAAQDQLAALHKDYLHATMNLQHANSQVDALQKANAELSASFAPDKGTRAILDAYLQVYCAAKPTKDKMAAQFALGESAALSRLTIEAGISTAALLRYSQCREAK